MAPCELMRLTSSGLIGNPKGLMSGFQDTDNDPRAVIERQSQFRNRLPVRGIKGSNKVGGKIYSRERSRPSSGAETMDDPGSQSDPSAENK
jgi:hypothetical protein